MMSIFIQGGSAMRASGLSCAGALLFYGSVLGLDSAYAQTGDTAMCPVGFVQTAEDDTTISCRFSQVLTTPPDIGVLPQDTAEGQSLLNQANTDCVTLSPISGQSTDAGDEGTDGVFLVCVVNKPEPPVDPEEPPVDPEEPPVDPEEPPVDPEEPPVDPAPTPEPEPEVIDFDQVLSIIERPFEQEVASSLVNICTRLLENDSPNQAEADMLQVCRDINAEENSGSQLNAVQNIAAKQFVDIGNLISFQNAIQVGDIGNRLASLRSAMAQNTRDVAKSSNAHPSQGLLAKSSSVKGGAAGDTNGKLDRFGVFVLGSAADGEKGNTERSRGFDYASSVLTLGIDYLVNDSTIVGLAYGYGRSESSLSDRTGAIDIQTDNINLYGSKYFGNGWFADAILGFGKIDTENRRFIKFTVNDVDIDQLARSQFDSDQKIISLGLGKTINRVVDIDLAARLNYIDTSIERFSESTDRGSAGFGLALEIEGYDLKSFTSDISASISKPFSRSWGVIVPKLTARWIHEFENGDDNLFGRFLADTSSFDFTQSNIELGSGPIGSTIFRVPLEKIDSNYGNLLVGATALLANQFSVNVAFSRTLGLSDFSHSYYSLTLRRDF